MASFAGPVASSKTTSCAVPVSFNAISRNLIVTVFVASPLVRSMVALDAYATQAFTPAPVTSPSIHISYRFVSVAAIEILMFVVGVCHLSAPVVLMVTPLFTGVVVSSVIVSCIVADSLFARSLNLADTVFRPSPLVSSTVIEVV